jgi:hypothetical protein
MGFWRTLWLTLARNPISTFAVFCVACTAGWLGFMSYKLLAVVSSPDWCAKAIQAEKISPGSTYVGLTTCVELLKIQLNGSVEGFHIALYAFAFSLVVLIVVVVAGARASGKLAGMEFNVGKDANAAAQYVVEGAQDAAAEVKGATP